MTDKIYIFMRRDLKMRRGKEIAQAAHAIIGLAVEDRPIITLKAQSEDDLLSVEQIAESHGLKSCLIRDHGRTEVLPDTATCIAVLGAPGGGQFEQFSLY
jgi:peptidyl-tRNA hydrolase